MHACAALVLPSVTQAEAFGYVQPRSDGLGEARDQHRRGERRSWVNQDQRTGLVVAAGDAGALGGSGSIVA